jgi:phasin family protein
MASVKAAQGARAAKDQFEGAAAAFDRIANGSSEALKGNVERAMTAAAEMNAFGKENFEAWVASTAATTKGIEALSARAVAYSKQALENHVAATKSLMTAKSVQELVERQTEYARSAFDGYVAELNKMSDLMAGFAKDAIKPINERVSAVSTIMQSARLR